MTELSVIVPTYKERGNVAELVRRLDAALVGIAWEAIYVDDNSPDGTAEAVKEIAARDPRIRCLKRVPPGAGGRLYRGDSLVGRALCRGDRCRPAA
jgi:glycosyltransferase involved in cell wall biosynthesis